MVVTTHTQTSKIYISLTLMHRPVEALGENMLRFIDCAILASSGNLVLLTL